MRDEVIGPDEMELQRRRATVTNDLVNSKFAKALDSVAVPEPLLRKFTLDYCKHYQDIYWFDSLEDVFAYLELTLNERQEVEPTELNLVKSEVEYAMGEYCISMNEVASALYRLLDEKPFESNDLLRCIEHVWNAYSCNEGSFEDREDTILCGMLENLTNGRS